MAWSTRELAELGGTTVNTIRHYHRLGLLAEPDRRYNGYKQYGVQDLVCLLRIRRLAELGVPLSQIGDVGAGGVATPEALREIDAELAASIDRLQKARDDIALILRDNSPVDAPAGFQSVAGRLSAADSSIIHIYTQLYDEDALEDVRRMVEADATDSVSAEVDVLPEDADEATRDDLVARLAPVIAKSLVDFPWLRDPAAHLSKSERVTRETMVEAVVELYNKAQLDVLSRASILAHEIVDKLEEGNDQ